MATKLRTTAIVAAVAFSSLPVAEAQNINITIQDGPTTQSEAGKQYRRGHEFDEMTRKGYVCYREAGSNECSWAKPERSTPRPHWGDCVQSESPSLGRMCERVLPDSSRWLYDFERPLVPLVEKVAAALVNDPDETRPATVKLLAALLKATKKIAKRVTDEQWKVIGKHFGSEIDTAFRIVDSEKWKAAQAKMAPQVDTDGNSPL